MGTDTMVLRQKLGLLDRVGDGNSGVDATPSVKLELLREVALSLLDEIDTLKNSRVPDVERGIDLFDEVERFETALIRRALRVTQGSQTRAARLLGINATTLNYKIKRYNISLFDPPDYSFEAVTQMAG
jgi:DNA-binding NtrC family response regulator